MGDNPRVVDAYAGFRPASGGNGEYPYVLREAVSEHLQFITAMHRHSLMALLKTCGKHIPERPDVGILFQVRIQRQGLLRCLLIWVLNPGFLFRYIADESSVLEITAPCLKRA